MQVFIGDKHIRLKTNDKTSLTNDISYLFFGEFKTSLIYKIILLFSNKYSINLIIKYSFLIS